MLMRKRMIRKGLRLVLAALLLIVLVSFYHSAIADLFSFSVNSEERLYGFGIYLAAAAGCYGVVLAVLGFLMLGDTRDAGVRLLPYFLLIAMAVLLFFWLLVSSFNKASNPGGLRPGETITI